jgi:hypothetical protein
MFIEAWGYISNYSILWNSENLRWQGAQLKSISLLVRAA